MSASRRPPVAAWSRFSNTFGVIPGSGDDWFDPMLAKDTTLFIDPFQIFVDKDPRWAGAHGRLMEFFDLVMKLVARGRHDRRSSPWGKAQSLLRFPEPAEFCLGYGGATVLGAGTGPGLGSAMLDAADDSIRLGLEKFEHFEELAILGALVGPDRISDMVCNVLKAEFITYTQAVARRRRIPMEEVPVRNASWDPRFMKWCDSTAQLPVNRFAHGRRLGVILTPKRFLRELPSLEPMGFWAWAWTTEGAELRNDFNWEIAQNVDAREVARLARQKNRLLRRYVSELEAHPPRPYNLDTDEAFLVVPEEGGREIAEALGRKEITSEEEFGTFIETIVENFKHCVESRSWRLLWAGQKPRRESHVQDLFHVSAVLGCQLSDVDISPETDAGRGPVDFKFSRGWQRRVLVEVKLAKSSSFWRNLETQPVTYAKAEGVDLAYFVVIQFNERDKRPGLVEKAQRLAGAVGQAHNVEVKVVWVDATPKVSASKVVPHDQLTDAETTTPPSPTPHGEQEGAA